MNNKPKQQDTEIKTYRICEYEGKQAKFHGFFQRSDLREMIGGHCSGAVASPVAVIETETGEVFTVLAHNIKFTGTVESSTENFFPFKNIIREVEKMNWGDNLSE